MKYNFISINFGIKKYKNKYRHELENNYDNINKVILRDELKAELLKVKNAIGEKLIEKLIVMPSILITVMTTAITIVLAYGYNVTDLNNFEKMFKIYESIPDNVENTENQELIKKYFGIKGYSESEIEKLKIEKLNEYKETIADDMNMKVNIGKFANKMITKFLFFPIIYIGIIIIFYSYSTRKNNIRLLVLKDYIVEKLQEEIVVHIEDYFMLDKINNSWIKINNLYLETKDILKIEEEQDGIHIFYLKDKEKYV